MQTFESRELESDGSTVSTSDFCSDACPKCGTTPIRFGTSERGNAKIRRYCPKCEAHHWELVARQQGHDAVLDHGGAA